MSLAQTLIFRFSPVDSIVNFVCAKRQRSVLFNIPLSIWPQILLNGVRKSRVLKKKNLFRQLEIVSVSTLNDNAQ